MAEIKYIAVQDLYPHPDNPRKELGDLTELADSIKANGIFQNLTVVPGHIMSKEEFAEMAKAEGGTKAAAREMYDRENAFASDGYTVVIGHRRCAAAKLAGLTHVPCVIVEMTPKEQVQTMLLENMQRADLTVYEQAQGFQMMLDLGSTVEEIAEKSGFSEKTVRRRVKMMELDQAKLKEVSARQISIGDFDALAQIEDIKERNKVLESIGTRDFDANLSRAMSTQAERKNRPLVKAWLKEIGAKEITSQEAWSNKYESYPGCGYYIYLSKWGEDGDKPPKDIRGEIFYVLERNSLRLYRKKQKVKPEKKSPEQVAREKAIAAAWKSLEESALLAYDLRKAFVEKLTVTKKNRETVIYGALLAVLLDSVEYISHDGSAIKSLLGIDTGSYEPNKGLKIAEKLDTITDEVLPRLVYAGFGDNEKDLCTGHCYKGNFPEYTCSGKLKLIYEWLQLLGYEPSTEEISMMDGSHAGFHAKEAYDAAK